MSESRQEKIAISLYYDGHGTPNVTAKGSGELAQRIIDIATAHNIPLQENPALAGVLAQIPVGEDIPEALYVAVAEVLAFAYDLCGYTPQDIKARKARNAEGTPKD